MGEKRNSPPKPSLSKIRYKDRSHTMIELKDLKGPLS